MRKGTILNSSKRNPPPKVSICSAPLRLSDTMIASNILESVFLSQAEKHAHFRNVNEEVE